VKKLKYIYIILFSIEYNCFLDESVCFGKEKRETKKEKTLGDDTDHPCFS